MQFLALQGSSHTAQCSLGPGSAVLGPGRVWGALTCCVFVCFARFVTGLVMAAWTPCSSPFIINPADL